MRSPWVNFHIQPSDLVQRGVIVIGHRYQRCDELGTVLSWPALIAMAVADNQVELGELANAGAAGLGKASPDALASLGQKVLTSCPNRVCLMGCPQGVRTGRWRRCRAGHQIYGWRK